MFSFTWTFWWIVLLVLLLPPIGYGWGYRGWGPPYPSYLQRRRAARFQVAQNSAAFDHYSWSWGGDLIWLVFLIAVFWGMSTYSWR